ncbi:glutamine amidotransferase [Conyzicola nivalis]|uniref:Glutamine amidotransferase n=1 Tax=Conyzicola nivalis TaxID=1477021 RepID=A0A916WFZ2_9MICO|nr:glutamine amidotransferase [Conyzicola nivalis]GGA93717.1 glutamine amidotransferase [Conyzicola nivalis]
MKPFLLLATRDDDEAADDEYRGFLEAGGLDPDELDRVRLEAAPMPAIDLDDYSGVIVGGSPFNASDAPAAKTAVQSRVERELGTLIDEIIERDFPFFGACYGIGLLTSHLGGVVDDSYPETAGPTRVALTADGETDQLFGRLDRDFDAFVGHKEACAVLPDGAVLLARGDRCPVQAFRIGHNVYATQFHPELSLASMLTRIRIYRDNGYFAPDAYGDVVELIRGSDVTEPAALVRAFVRRFGGE